MSGTYLGSSVAKMAGNHFIPGSGDAVTSITARAKSDLLRDILQTYFHDNAVYKGGDIPLNDAKQAIKYARSKKLTKSNRKAVIAGAKFVGFVAGAATGATIGSVVPVAGTVVGGVAAVSYTHLDVYKRQAKKDASRHVKTRAALPLRSADEASDAGWPVS